MVTRRKAVFATAVSDPFRPQILVQMFYHCILKLLGALGAEPTVGGGVTGVNVNGTTPQIGLSLNVAVNIDQLPAPIMRL
jgi:hypothetical protein